VTAGARTGRPYGSLQGPRRIAEGADIVARFVLDVPRFLHHPLPLAAARARVRENLATREQRFVAVVERLVYRNPRSPYLTLLRHAGCERDDLRALVERDGVEGALATLAERGVYVTYDELKGRAEAVRGSRRFLFRPEQFDNPTVRPHLLQYTSGSGGRSSPVRYALPFLEERAASLGVVFEAHGIRRPQLVCWWPVPLAWLVAAVKLGHPAIGWFYPVSPLPRLAALPSIYLGLMGKLLGFEFPSPQRCDLATPERLLDWLAPRLRDDQEIVLHTMSSAGVRLALEASMAGRRLDGLTMMVGGEMTTQARRRQIEASGARAIVGYSTSELGGAAYSCPEATVVDDVHVMVDRLAVIRRSRSIMADGPVVDALLFTSISQHAGKVLFNAETGDTARIDVRDCDCRLGRLGMRTHLSDIRSFEKLTGEGVTFARSHLAHILEAVLPARFGGSSLGYQLVEEASPSGATLLVLRVHPSVGAVDESALRSALLDELGRGSEMDRYQARIWRSAGTLVIRREAPQPTRAGKVLPFQLASRAGIDAARSP
jgi:hypothetical protein